jgi:hypothetical protein
LRQVQGAQLAFPHHDGGHDCTDQKMDEHPRNGKGGVIGSVCIFKISFGFVLRRC